MHNVSIDLKENNDLSFVGLNHSSNQNQTIENTKFKEYVQKNARLLLNNTNASFSSNSSNSKPLMTSLRVTIDMNDVKKFYKPQNKKTNQEDTSSKKYYFNLRLIRLFEDNTLKVYFYFDSITSSIQNKELRKNLEEKDMILASVTHDLRAPLIAVNHTLQKVEEEVKDMSEYLQTLIKGATSSCNLLHFLINDILDAAKLVKTGTLTLKLEVTSIDDIFIDIFKIMKHRFKQSEVDFETYIAENVPDILVSDPRRLKQIILNFVTNSFKFTTRGRVLLMAKMFEGRQDILEVSVLDTGIGIKDDEQKKIFDKFYTSGGKVNKNGVGLGLSICKTLVNLLGPCNKIFFKSKYNVGSKFWIYIYLDLEDKHDHERNEQFFGMGEAISIPSHPSIPTFRDLPENNSIFEQEDETYTDESALDSIPAASLKNSTVSLLRNRLDFQFFDFFDRDRSGTSRRQFLSFLWTTMMRMSSPGS